MPSLGPRGDCPTYIRFMYCNRNVVAGTANLSLRATSERIVVTTSAATKYDKVFRRRPIVFSGGCVLYKDWFDVVWPLNLKWQDFGYNLGPDYKDVVLPV